jgi:hypothetical protein
MGRPRAPARSTVAAIRPRLWDSATRVCLLLRGADPAHYERAAIRWLGRLCLERPDVALTELRLALVAFERLPEEPDEAAAELRRLVWA